MSSDPNSDALAELEFVEAALTYISFENSATIAFTALYLYDYFLTFSREVSAIWQSKFAGTTLLFIISRYGFFLYLFLTTFATFVSIDSTSVTNTLLIIELIALSASIGSISGIFVLRTYALWGLKRLILILLVPLLLGGVGYSIFGGVLIIIQINNDTSPGIVCNNGNCVIPGELIFSLPSNVIGLVFDIAVFFLTVSRTAVMARQAKALGIKNSLTRLFLRDGSMYIATLSVLRISVILASILPTTPELLNSIFSAALSPLQAIILNRLVLNLRSLAQTDEAKDIESRTDMFFRNAYIHPQGGVRSGFVAEPGLVSSFMTSFIGNLAAPLDVIDDLEDEEVEEDSEQLTWSDLESKGKAAMKGDDFEDDEIVVGSAEGFSLEV